MEKEPEPRLKAIWDHSFDRIASMKWLYELSKRQPSGKSLHPFAHGHLFSSSLAEEIERFTDKSATWGQIYNGANGLSSEVDVIVYHGKPSAIWPRAGYALVTPEQFVATVNCKVELMTNAPSLQEFQASITDLKRHLRGNAKNYVLGEYVIDNAIHGRPIKKVCFDKVGAEYLCYMTGPMEIRLEDLIGTIS